MNQDPHGRIVLWLSARRTALPIGYEIQTISGLFSKRKTDQPIIFNWRIFGSQPNGQAASYLAWRNYEGWKHVKLTLVIWIDKRRILETSLLKVARMWESYIPFHLPKTYSAQFRIRPTMRIEWARDVQVISAEVTRVSPN